MLLHPALYKSKDAALRRTGCGQIYPFWSPDANIMSLPRQRCIHGRHPPLPKAYETKAFLGRKPTDTTLSAPNVLMYPRSLPAKHR